VSCCQDASAAEVRLAQAEEDLSSNTEALSRQQQQLAALKQQTTSAQAGLADAQAALARVKQQVQVRAGREAAAGFACVNSLLHVKLLE
jgi:multidrug resistance efflux pump